MPVYQVTIKIPLVVNGDSEKDAIEQAVYIAFQKLNGSISVQDITATIDGQTSFF
jgi:hypothetical protein